ncbi:hypothetical protein PFISCL1PPCAC_1474, partial [Pristionchus fissidentatus]
ALFSLNALLRRSFTNESLLALARSLLTHCEAVAHLQSISTERFETLIGALSVFLIGTARVDRARSAPGTVGSVSARASASDVGATD